MTNKDVLEIRGYFQAIENEFFNKDSKWDISKKVFYVGQKFLRRSKSIQTEADEIIKDIQKVFKEEVKYDESKKEDKAYLAIIEGKYQSYFKSNNQAIIDFHNEICDEDFHGFSNEDLEEITVPIEVLDHLIMLVK